jgi:lysophospholipase L1-like esterase
METLMANPTIGATTPRIQYTATASQTVFTVPFEFLANADLAVYVNGTLKTLTTDYTLTGANTTGGGSLTFVTGRTAGEIVTILGNLAYSRNTNKYTKYGLLPAEVLEADFDAVQVQSKQLALADQFALRLPMTDSGSAPAVLPAKASRANTLLGFDANGAATVILSAANDVSTAISAAQAAQAAAEAANVAAQLAKTNAETAETNAETAETNAETAEAAAELAQAAAELARDASWTNNKIYATTAAGLAATSSGAYFSIPSSDANFAIELYLNNAGTAVLQKKYLSSAFTADAVTKATTLANAGLFSDTVGTATPAAGAAAFGGATTVIFDKPIPHDGSVYSITISANTSGTIKIKRFTKSGTTLTFQSEISVSVSAGVNTYGPDTLSLLSVTAGDYIAVYTPTSVLKYTSTTTDAPYFSSAGDNITTYTITAAATANILAQVRLDIYGRISGLIASQTIAQQAKSVMDERGVTFTLGATTVADKTTTLSTTSTFLSRDSNPEPGVINQLQFYSKAVGSAIFTVIKPTAGGGYTRAHSFVVRHAIGINTYSVSAGTLPLMVIPRGCLFGVLANTATSITYDNGTTSEGYFSTTGEITGAVSTLAQVYGRQVQLQVQVFSPSMIRKIGFPVSRYPIDLNVTTAAAIPAGAKSAGMSYSSNYAVSTTTGISTAYLESFFSDNNHRMTARATIQLRSADARVAVYRRPVLNLASIDSGTVAEVDIANNRIILYQTWGGSTLPSTRSTQTLTTITLTQNRDYRCDLTNDKKQISFTIYDTVTGVSETLTVDSDAVADAAGLGYGAAGVAVIAGTGAVSRVSCFPIIQNPKLLIIGDSITEGSGTTQANAWANLTATAMSNLVHVSADGGTTSDAVLRKLYEALNITPSLQYVLILIGTNDAAAGATGVTNWQTNVPLAKILCEDFGVIPIIAHVIPRNDANQTYVDTINTYIRTQAYRTVRFDLALSVSNDGSTWKTSLMNDGVHPNTAGHLAMYNRLRLDIPELFD